MDKIELARKALDDLLKRGHFFPVTGISCYEGGACGGGYDDESGDEHDIYLSQAEVYFLIKDKTNEQVFDGLEIEEVNPDEKIESVARDVCHPDHEATAYCSSPVPVEFNELEELINDVDVSDKAALADIRSKLQEIKDGDYNIIFNITQDYEYLAEDEEIEFHLTGDEVRALLRYSCDKPEVFEGICDEELTEEFLEDKAEEDGIAEGYDYYSYSAECDVSGYIYEWKRLIQAILSGDVTEENIDARLDTLRHWNDVKDEDEEEY